MQTGIKATMSQRAITTLFFLGFALGVVIATVVLHGSQIPLKCFEAGNAADWLAATGTWIIGYGAWRVAREAHRHRMTESFEVKRKEAVALAVKLRALSFASASPQALERSLKTLLTKTRPVNLPTLKAIFEFNKGVSADMVWPDSDREALDLDALQALAFLKSSAREFFGTVDSFDGLVGEADKATFDARTSPAFALLIQRVEKLSNDSKVFIGHCDRLIRALDLD
ncbi:hypothetical protein [uncultured Stenotrophomonas sp.]|uniref:hypothetical protein n=1 Tax=uncultured Stenotrophomonas sp. TaxID=165438 RepID=UPI0025DA83E1|nr:hypothetical protein [uncultured Stenotrophomonas sp.]